MTIRLKESTFEVSELDSRPGLGVYNLMSLPIDVMQKHLQDQDEKDADFK